MTFQPELPAAMTTGLGAGGGGVVVVGLDVVVVDVVVDGVVVVVVVLLEVVVVVASATVLPPVEPVEPVDVEVPGGVGVPVRSSARAAGAVTASAMTASVAATLPTVRFLSMRMVLMVSPGVLTARRRV
ncbi:hypothetical protein ASE25_03235 [Terrabacter sp. Root85]|nr:hypothetical protein ASE25_03235 [Terrabacter sp. Root85]